MREEIFDIVDEADVVIGRAPRSEIHRSNVRHRAVHILVFKPGGELLLQRRAPWKDCAPDLWDTSAAGHVDGGEAYEVAAHRELGEELGIISEQPLIVIGKLAASAITGYEFVTVFKLTTALQIHPDPHEIVATRWCSANEVDVWLAANPHEFTGTFKQIWQMVRDDLSATPNT